MAHKLHKYNPCLQLDLYFVPKRTGVLALLTSAKQLDSERRHIIDDCMAMQLGPYYIPKGTGVHINLWAMQTDARYWKDPETFKPERWVGDKTGGDMSGGLAYMPFGQGPRMCIGIKLARKPHSTLSTLSHFIFWPLLCCEMQSS